VKASRNKLRAGPGENDSTLEKAAPASCGCTDHGLDLSLLEDSLAKTPWERMLANDDALRFADSLRAALEKSNAKP
jgi:hypothetical protein